MRSGDRPRWRREDNEWEVLLGRILKLPESDRLSLHGELTAFLGGKLGEETVREKEVRRRREALDALDVVAKHLKLPPGRAPKVLEYKRAAKEGKAPMTFKAVYAAFDQRWDLATRAFRRERLPETHAQRAIQRAVLGRNRTTTEAPITGVRMFLAQDPPPASTDRTDYEKWARETNEHLPAGTKRIVEACFSIRSITRLSWQLCLAVARNEISLERAQEERLEDLLSEAGPLVGHFLASWVLGQSVNARHAYQPGYPKPVVRLGRAGWLWRLEDIRAYAEGERDFHHARGSMQSDYIETRELARRLRIRPRALTNRLMGVRATGDDWLVPAATGRASGMHYWEVARAERWIKEHPDAVGPRPPARRRAP